MTGILVDAAQGRVPDSLASRSTTHTIAGYVNIADGFGAHHPCPAPARNEPGHMLPALLVSALPYPYVRKTGSCKVCLQLQRSRSRPGWICNTPDGTGDDPRRPNLLLRAGNGCWPPGTMNRFAAEPGAGNHATTLPVAVMFPVLLYVATTGRKPPFTAVRLASRFANLRAKLPFRGESPMAALPAISRAAHSVEALTLVYRE